MPSRGAKRKRGDFERTSNDDSSKLSESGASSFRPDNDEDTNSVIEDASVAGSEDNGIRGDIHGDCTSSSSLKVRNAQTSLKIGEIPEKMGMRIDRTASKVEGNGKKTAQSTNLVGQVEPRNTKKRKIDISSSTQAIQFKKNCCGIKRQQEEVRSSGFANKASLQSTKELAKGNDAVQKKKKRMNQGTTKPKNIGHYDKKVIKQVCQRLKEGTSPESIAKELGMHIRTVYNWREKYISKDVREEMSIRSRELKLKELLADKKVMEIRNLMKQGASTKYLIERFRMNENTIARWRVKYAPETLKGYLSPAYSEETILTVCNELLKKDVTSASIALKMRISRMTINAWKQKYLLAKFQETTPEGTWEYNTYTKLTAYNRLRQGEIPDIIAKELEIPISVLRKWESERAIFSTPESGYKFDKQLKINVCERLQQGESVPSIAAKLGIGCKNIYDWKMKYCSSDQPKPTNGRIYKKDTILRALKLLKSGEEVKGVARKLQISAWLVRRWRLKYLKRGSSKFNTLSTVLYLARKCQYRRLVLEAYRLSKQGDSSQTVAKKLKMNLTLVQIWKRKYFLKKIIVTKDDLKLIQQLRGHFTWGDTTHSISKKFGIADLTVDEWRCKYLEEVSSKYLKNMIVAGKSIDAKLKSQPIVVLQKDQKVDKLCQSQCIHPIKCIDGLLIKRALNRLKNGVSSKSIAKELGVTEQRVERWRMKFIPREMQMRFEKLIVSKGKGVTGSSSFTKRKVKKRKVAKIFIPLRKVYIPNRTKLKFVKMIEDGLCAKKIAKELNVHEIIINSWTLNRNLLMRSNAAKRMKYY